MKRFLKNQEQTIAKAREMLMAAGFKFGSDGKLSSETPIVIEYLTNVRIENAKRLLRETEMKGYDIAYECGFSDPHYFSYIFKKNTGLSPRDYKQEFIK